MFHKSFITFLNKFEWKVDACIEFVRESQKGQFDISLKMCHPHIKSIQYGRQITVWRRRGGDASRFERKIRNNFCRDLFLHLNHFFLSFGAGRNLVDFVQDKNDVAANDGAKD